MSREPHHRIRLQGPWEVIPPGGDLEGEAVRVAIPATWNELFGEESGTARFRRRFHSPNGLSASQRVVIRLPKFAGNVGRFTLNETVLAHVPKDLMAFDVTEVLRSFNLLEFDLYFDPETAPNAPGGLWSSVLLEIALGEK